MNEKNDVIKNFLEDKTNEEVFLELETILNLFGEDEEDEDSVLNTLFAALELPDENFALIREPILNELEKQFNQPQMKLMITQSLNSYGMNVDMLIDRFQGAIEELEELLTGKISYLKIDFIKRIFGLFIHTISSTEGVSKRIVPVSIELFHEDAKLPTYAKTGDAGMDIYAIEDIEILPGETKIIPTGFKVAIPLGHELQVRPRSGLSVKTPLRIANSPGTIDANYRGEVGVIVWNSEPKIKDIEVDYDENGNMVVKNILYGASYTITKGMRFAQLVLSETPAVAFFEVQDIGEIEGDRAGGFGSSGLH